MKQEIKRVALFVVLFATIVLAGCEKSDSSTQYGNSVIFIPQSTVSGGLNLHYLVPTGFDKNTFNFKVDTLNQTVNVFLGISRSGLENYDSYSVNVETRTDTINTLIANGGINLSASAIPVVLLPASDYTLPATVTVPAGKYATTFYLAINMTALKAYSGQKVALCVAITNPSKFTLSPKNNKVIVLIDVDALKLP